MRHLPRILTFAATMLVVTSANAETAENLQLRVAEAHALLDGAEVRFRTPSDDWFFETQASLREEVDRVAQALEAAGPEYAEGWKAHLRWHLLENNLQSMDVDLAELELVRRWMFSNREGLEGPFFAELRRRMDLYLDAVFTFSHKDLQATFEENVALARNQCLSLTEDYSDDNAVALGRTLGWFDRTGQLSEEVQEIRSLLSLPNAQLVFSSKMAQQFLNLFDTEVDQSLNISNSTQAPPSGLLQRRRTLQVRGKADTVGSTQIALVPNLEKAQFNLIYHGEVDARCQADAGPALLHVRTSGPVDAIKPIFLSGDGLDIGETEVDSQVTTKLHGVTANNPLIRRMARSRANQPSSKSHMHTSAQTHTSKLLQENMDERVDDAVAEIRAEIARARESMGRFQDITAPVVREGAEPRLHGLRSTLEAVEVNISAERRNHLGAVIPYTNDTVGGDVQARVHVSFFNNTLETILGGKRLSDEFLMRYAKILQADLPLPLMVHARSRRWAITTQKERPLEFRNPEPNQLELIMRIKSVEIEGQTFESSTTATIRYQLVENDLAEFELVREGEVDLQTQLATAEREFLLKRLDAFFSPLLNAGGVAIPDGGMMTALNDIKLAGVQFARDWMVVGIDVPASVIEEVIRLRREQSNQTDSVATQ